MGSDYDSLRLTRTSVHGYPSLVSGRAGAASVSREGSELAVKVMREGGNAFDAAFALAFALALYHPQAGNIGGGGYLLFKTRDSDTPRVINYRERAPAISRREHFLDADGRVDPETTSWGPGSMCVPGTVKAFFALQREHGRLDPGFLLEDVAERARKGFLVTAYQAACLNRLAPKLAISPESRKVYVRKKPYRAGDQFANPRLADTLETLARKGEDAFYGGSIAQAIERDVRGNGGFVTVEDLLSYRITVEDAVGTAIDGRQVWSVPPEGGGVILLEILAAASRLLDGSVPPFTRDFHHVIAQVSKMAFIDRLVYMGDTESGRAAFMELLSDQYSAKLASLVDPAGDRETAYLVHALGRESSFPSSLLSRGGAETTHFSVLDEEGNGVSNSYTLNLRYGSKWSIDGCGFLMNGSMDAFSFDVGVPNYFNIIGSEPNLFAPGKRPASNMAPAMVTRGKQIDMMLGSPGGPTIPTTLASLILAIVKSGHDPASCVTESRFHHQGWPDLLYSEPDPRAAAMREELAALRYGLKERAEPISDVHGVFRNGEEYLFVSDYRREGGSCAL